MFELGSALVLGLVVVGLISLAKAIVDGPNRTRVIVLICLVISFVTVVLVAASDFAHEQVILKRTLDSMNFASQMIVVVLLTGLAAGIWEGFTTIKNIGHNQPDVVVVPDNNVNNTNNA